MTNEQLKAIRKGLNLSAPEFAKLLGVPIRTYYDREAGKVAIRKESSILVRFVQREMGLRGKI